MPRSSRQAASEIARARWWLRVMFRTLRSSITTAWFSRTSRVVSLCRWSRRRSAIRACTRATLRLVLALLAEPFCLRASLRCARASRARSRRSCRGLAIFCPVDRVTSDVSPASIPTTASDRGCGSTAHSHSRDTNQRPALSRLTVTVDGRAPSGSGRDQRMSSGPLILARVSCPSCQRNADRVSSADWRDRLRDLNRGYAARLSQNAANAAWRWRSACCSGTLDTSLR
jgi:hypothetical protein